MTPEPVLPECRTDLPDTPQRHEPNRPTLACAAPAPVSGRPKLAEDCWFLTGPTAAGKSALAVPLARHLGAEIVSVDSMAVYRGLDIGTAKPTAADRDAIPHHCLDLVSPATSYSVAEWLASAAAAVEDCRSRGRRILFVGGTPLYLRGLRDGLAELPPADMGLRERLLAESRRHGSEWLHARLASLDPATALRLHPNDTKRIVRALEVATLTGLPISASHVPAHDPIFEERLMILDVARGELSERIDRRVDAMFAGGILEETAVSLAAPGGIGPTARQAPGYTEAIQVLAGHLDVAEAIRRTQARTRQLAKRQRTWFRSFKRATWIGA